MTNYRDMPANQLPISVHEQRLYGPYSLESVEAKKNRLPKSIEVHPSNRCNLACKHCFFSTSNANEEMEDLKVLTSRQLLLLIEQIGKSGVSEISFSGGGEPTLDEELGSYIGLSKHLGMITRLVTNGSNLGDHNLEQISQCDEIRLSMDSFNPDLYGDIKGTDKPGHKLIEIRNFIESLRQFGYTGSLLATIIYQSSDQDLLSEIEEAKKFGFDGVIIKQDIKDSKGSIVLSANNLRSSTFVDSSFADIREFNFDMSYSGNCLIPFVKPAIDRAGRIYSCCLGAQSSQLGGYILGRIDLDKVDFLSAWESTASMRHALSIGRATCNFCNYNDRRFNLSFSQTERGKV